jgi:hypothetical protein
MYLTDIATRIKAALPRHTNVPQDSDSLFLLYALLAKTKGSTTSLADIHDAWCVWMYPRNPSHAAMIPFESLTPNIKQEDQAFLDATLRVAQELETGGTERR